MDRILNVENKDTRVEFVNQFSLIAQDYLKAVDNHEKVVVDFHFSDQINAICSQNLFGRLLIDQKIPNVLCRRVNNSPKVIKAIFDGVLQSFLQSYPNGIYFHGLHILQPQVEMYDPSGDKVYSVVRLSDEDYEAIRK